MSQIRILLAEDSRQRQHLLLRALVGKRSHVNVTVVDREAEFLRALKMRRFDCAILDRHGLGDHFEDLFGKAISLCHDCPVLVVGAADEESSSLADIDHDRIELIARDHAIRDDVLWARVERAVKQAQRRSCGHTDTSTGLTSRASFGGDMDQGRWRSSQSAACAMLSVDRFDQPGDQAVTDDLLRRIGAELRNHKADTTVRWSDRQFMVIRPLVSMLDAWLWAESLRQRVVSPRPQTDAAPSGVTISIGLAVGAQPSRIDQLIDRADDALRLAHELGGDMICTADMVNIVRQINAVNRTIGDNIEHRRDDLLHRLAHHTGPTQQQHISVHCEQVAGVAVLIAGVLGLDEITVNRIRIAALMHDIGKCLIPEELLAKPRSLMIDEWKLMAKHDNYGAWITEQLGLDALTTRYLKNHHQRHDESMPDHSHAPNDPVPLGAKVLCVADALVTMLTDRPYRAARTPADALAELRRCCGQQFDPRVVDAAHHIHPADARLAA